MTDTTEITASSDAESVLTMANARSHKDCEVCNNGCRMGSGVLAPEDESKIAEYMKISIEELRRDFLEPVTRFNTTMQRPKLLRHGKSYGKCVFFDEQKKCMINDVKPLECKTATCDPIGEKTSQWFMLKYFVNPSDNESLRQWNSYIKQAINNDATNNNVIPGSRIEELIPDEKLRNEILSN